MASVSIDEFKKAYNRDKRVSNIKKEALVELLSAQLTHTPEADPRATGGNTDKLDTILAEIRELKAIKTDVENVKQRTSGAVKRNSYTKTYHQRTATVR